MEAAITELGTQRFKIERRTAGNHLSLTVGPYAPVHFEERYLGELVDMLRTFQRLSEGGDAL